MRIVYLGKKPFQTDRWFKSGVMWNGHGDVQTVPDDIGRQMIDKFPSVYGEAPADSALPGHEEGDPLALFGGGDVPTAILDTVKIPDQLAEGGEVTLREAKFAPLKAWVEGYFGVAVRVGTSRTELLDMAVELLQAGKGAGEDPPPPPNTGELPPAGEDPPPEQSTDPAAAAGEDPPPPAGDDPPPASQDDPPAGDPPPAPEA